MVYTSDLSRVFSLDSIHITDMIMNLKDDRSENVRYDYSDYPIYIRRGFLSAYPNYAAPPHWHDDIEFITVLSGHMKYNVNGKIITIGKNEGIIVNTRQIHFGFSSDKKECHFTCVLLHPLLLCTTSAYEHDFILPILNNRNIPFVKLMPNIKWQKDINDEIDRIYSEKDDKTAPMKVQCSFVKIWTLLYENIQPEDTISSQRADQNTDLSILKNMIGFIQQKYMNKVTLADIAASGAVGQSKCCKLFAKYIEKTPNTYLTQYRLNKSIELLQNTDMTITEIAYAIGYNGSSYYAESLRKWCGKCPTDYRI